MSSFAKLYQNLKIQERKGGESVKDSFVVYSTAASLRNIIIRLNARERHNDNNDNNNNNNNKALIKAADLCAFSYCNC